MKPLCQTTLPASSLKARLEPICGPATDVPKYPYGMAGVQAVHIVLHRHSQSSLRWTLPTAL